MKLDNYVDPFVAISYPMVVPPWAPTPAGNESLKLMQKLIKSPDTLRPTNIAIIGEPNQGKSHLVKYFASKHPIIRAVDESEVPVLLIEMPPTSDATLFVKALMDGLGAIYPSNAKLPELIRRFVVLVKALHVKIVIIDEFNNGFSGRRDQMVVLLNTIRTICNKMSRPIVVAGISKVEDLLRNDQQLHERFCFTYLNSFKDVTDAQRFVKAFILKYPFTDEPTLCSDNTVRLILDLTDGRLGLITGLILAAEAIMQTKGTKLLTEDILREAAKTLPGQKKLSRLSQ